MPGDWDEVNAHSHTKAARAVCRIVFISETAAGACTRYVGRGGTVSVAVPVWQHLAEHGMAAAAEQSSSFLSSSRSQGESEGAGGGGRKESGEGRPAQRGRRLSTRRVVMRQRH